MMRRGKLRKGKVSKGRCLKKETLSKFNSIVKNNNKKKIIIGAIVASVLSLSCVGYFQGKNAFASNTSVHKSLVIINEAENVNTVTPYDKLAGGEEINVLFLGDNSYLGDVILEEDVKSFIENTYNSKVNITNISADKASIYKGLNEYTNIENRKFDLAFLCFENNDEGEVSKTNFSGIYESILRDLKYNNTSVDIIPIIKHETLVSDTYYQIINGLSKYYDLELAKVNENVQNNNVEGENIEDFRESYTNTLTDIIKNNVENNKTIDTEYKDVYYGVTTLFEPYKVTVKGDKKKGFSISQSRAKSNNANDYIRYKVEGNIVGLGYETSANGGIIEIYVNRILYKRIDTKSDIEDLKYILISSNLSGSNEIKIVNSNGGDIILLGVITSGNNTNSKEVENLNNILARNTGNYSAQVKDHSLYENAEVEEKKQVVEVEKTESKAKPSQSTSSTKRNESTQSSQSKPSSTESSESKENSSSSVNSQVTESIENNNKNSNSITNNNESMQMGGSSQGNNNYIENNGGDNQNNNSGNNSNASNNTVNDGGNSNNQINNEVGNGGEDSINSSANNGGDNWINSGNNTVNNGGGSLNNNTSNSINNNISGGGNNQSNNSGNNGNASNNTVNNNINDGGNIRENNSNGGDVSQNSVSNWERIENVNPVENVLSE